MAATVVRPNWATLLTGAEAAMVQIRNYLPRNYCGYVGQYRPDIETDFQVRHA
jgi:hypothetical protein